MARPRSEDKRNAILAAATQAIARQGLGAPTAKIAQLAGVAEGTLFTYFKNKADLVNQLYLELKSELREVMLADYPKSRNAKSQTQHVWDNYVTWGAAHPRKRKVLAQLGVSDKISEKTRTAGMVGFTDFHRLVEECLASGAMRGPSVDFVRAMLGSLAETTMDFMIRDPANADTYRESGFDALWSAIAKK